MARRYDRVRLVIDFVRQEDGSYKNFGFVTNPMIYDDDEALPEFDRQERELKIDQTGIAGEIPNAATVQQIKNVIKLRILEQANAE